jgi:hypothetical protein
MSSDHGHATDSDDHGHGPTVPESELIKESSPQDWLLILCALAIVCSLSWYGWQWANTPIPAEAESGEHAVSEHAEGGAEHASEPAEAESTEDAATGDEAPSAEDKTSAPAENSESH